jgi:hypothetical protein
MEWMGLEGFWEGVMQTDEMVKVLLFQGVCALH